MIKRYSMAQSLPIRPTDDLSQSLIDSLRATLCDYSAMIDNLKNSFMFFLENVTNKFNDSPIAVDEDSQKYRDIVDLFTFNHFDLKLEITHFEANRGLVLEKFEDLFESANRNKQDPRFLRTNYDDVPSMHSDRKDRDAFNDLKAKLTKFKRKNEKMKQVIGDWRMKYQDLLKQLEAVETRIEQMRKEKKAQDSFGNFDFNSLDKAKSVNDVGWLDNRNKLILNKSFQFMPDERAVSKYTYNSHTPLNERYSSSAVVKRRATFGDIRLNIDNLSDQNGFREDISRQNDEIDLLNREIELLKKEINAKNKEKILLADSYEKSLKFEKEMAVKTIVNLRKNIQTKEEKAVDRHSGNKFDTRNSQVNINHTQQMDLIGSFQENVQKSLISQLEQKKKTMQTLRNNLDHLLEEKHLLKSQLAAKSQQAEDMIAKILQLENSNQNFLRNHSDLEMANAQLTNKFLAAIERENNLMRQLGSLRTKLRAYEKIISDINQGKN
jgi:chromosome segregation ATPase